MPIQLPQGYRFAGVHCGLKSDASLLDLSLVVSDKPATAAGVFTPNLVCGAPVLIDRSRVPGTGFRAVVGNSRYANACTGEHGVNDAAEMAALAAQVVGGEPDKGLVISTGVIGTMLPMDKVRSGIAEATKKLAADENGFLDAVRGIMTTDTVEKYVTKTFNRDGLPSITLVGFCKGAAMIAPHLATMLAVVLTDAALEPAAAQHLLQNVAEVSFNCITVDGHTSTSDTLLFLANGAADPVPLTDDELHRFAKVLQELCLELAIKIPADAEGGSHLVRVEVNGCVTVDDAKKIARSIAEDVLVKTSICGADPNWGRIVSKSGTAGVPYNPKGVSLRLNGYELFRDGEPLNFNKAEVSQSIRDNKNTAILLTLSEGSKGITFWTSDLTQEYVRLNSDYTT